jgi:parallel beta-helix repeat protein
VDDVPGGSPAENFTSIQDAINASNDGDTVFVYNGTYYENVVVNKTINLIGEDKNNTIIDGGGSGDVVLVSSNWVNVSGFNMINAGDNGFPEYDSGIELNNVSYCTIIDNYAFGNSNGIYLGNSDMNFIIANQVISNFFGIYLGYSDNNNISGNNITSSSIDGIQSRYSDQNTFFNNEISDSINGIHLSWSMGCILDSNKMRNVGIIIQGAMIEYWNSHNINISNTVNGRGVYFLKNQTGGTIPIGFGQIILANCNNIKISGHNLSNTSMGLLLGFSSGSNITGNTFLNNFFGLRLVWSYDNIITENDFETNHNGIHISLSDRNKITNNNIQSTSQDSIEIWGSKYNDIVGNIATLSNIGIELSLTEENNCTGNELSENTYGMQFFRADQNNISYNNLYLNTYSGIYLSLSENNTLTNNNVINNQNGFNILSSSVNNSIFHNNIIENGIQALDETNGSNFWDNGYPSGGNFWSDYIGIDEFSGPKQDLPGNDGIGDTNYSIDSDSVDNYPLMIPIGNLTYLYKGWNLISIPLIQDNQVLSKALEPMA